MRLARRAAADAALALSFLTVIPVRARPEPGGLGSAAAWFPAVGALVGLAAGAVRLAADRSLGAGVAAVLAVLALVALTGAIHEDGLADCADALGVRGGRERRLAVMRDSTIGVFGMLAIVLWALLLVSALAALPRAEAVPTLVLAGALGRWAAVLHAAAVPPARRDGLGAAFVPGRASVLAATAMSVIVILLLEPLRGLAAAAGAAVVVAALSASARRALGGRTGDTLGATVALTEALVCVVLLGFARQ
jgi:adenosylcobinamide-GDP ribazoletransferase